MSLPPTDVQHRFPLVKLGPAGQKKEMIMMVIFCNGIFSSNFTLFYSQIGSILSQQFRALASHLGRVAEVGKLSASAKNAFNSFVGRVFANSRQKTLFFCVLPKLQQKGSFYLVLPSFYLVLPSFT